LRRFLVDLGKTAGTYLLVVGGGTLALLLATTFIGYLPYSDRPGPGWYGLRVGITLGEVSFLVSWAIFLVIPAAVIGAMLFISAQLLLWIRTPRWLIATLGAAASALLSLILVAATGWIIAIGAVPVYGAALLGGVYGGWLLPNQAAQSATSVGLGARQRLAILGIWCLATAWIAFPFVPWPFREADQSLEVIIVQWIPGPETLVLAADGLTADEVAQMAAMGVTGQLSRRGTFGGGKGIKHARAVIVMQRPVDSPLALPEPNGSSLIYLQELGGWKKIPPHADTLRRSIRLTIANAPGRIIFETDNGPSGGTFFEWAEAPKGAGK